MMTDEQRSEYEQDCADIRYEMKCHKYQKCPDRMCGADDCSACNPQNFHGGIYIDDIEE